ncbi:MAG TPA: hydrogenase maturation nickel metallochaperone HypA [Archaeoglobaceae archaeon]|nr:hydrogenase maturation nickel metallochaperone HypA [Archaeoglobaceae archaeon]
MGFAQSLFEHVMKIAEENNAKKVSKITLKMGELLLINPEQLEFCFRVLSNGSILKDSKLEIEFVKPLVKCIACGKEYNEVRSYCDCGGIVSVEGGKDIIIKKIEMEV